MIGANGAGAALVRSLCDGHHKKALFNAELPKKNRAFLTASAPGGISSDLMQSQEDAGLSTPALMHKSSDDGP